MEQGETSSKASSEPILDDSELTFNGLDFASQELDEKYIFLKFQYSKLKRENNFLKENLTIVSKKKKICLFLLRKSKRTSIFTRLHARKNPMISFEKNEFEVLRKKNGFLN